MNIAWRLNMNMDCTGTRQILFALAWEHLMKEKMLLTQWKNILMSSQDFRIDVVKNLKMIRHKYSNKITECGGKKFHSKLEAKYYNQLMLRKKSGEVVFFLMQVPLYIDAGVTMVIDFVEFLSDGSIEFVEIKGVETPLYIAKKKLVESKYPFKIKVLKRGMF